MSKPFANDNAAFEHSFRRALNAVKANKTLVARDLNHVAGQTRIDVIGNFEFWQRSGTSEDVLDSPIAVWSKVRGRQAIVALITHTGKRGTKYTGPQSLKIAALDAIETFWKRLEISPYEAQGWRLTAYSDRGWGYVTQGEGGGLRKEIAILAASMPGSKIDTYSPAGKLLSYPQRQKLKIPTEMYEEARIAFHAGHVFSRLLNEMARKGLTSLSVDVPRRVRKASK